MITIFERLSYDCRTHPLDVLYINGDPEHCVASEYCTEAVYDTMRELVESQGCNWYWWCEYYDRNPLDEKWGKHSEES